MPIIEQAFDLIGQFTGIIGALKSEVITLRNQLDEANKVISQKDSEIQQLLREAD